MKQAKIESLISECKKYIPLDGRVLICALPLKRVKQKDYTFAADKDSKLNQGKDPNKHRVDIKKVWPMTNAKYQQAIVLQVPLDEHRFKVGDTVIYVMGSVNEFDQIKGVSIIRKYDVVAVVQDHGVELNPMQVYTGPRYDVSNTTPPQSEPVMGYV